MEVVETDLGEWIIQPMASALPMVLPAIHMTRGRCRHLSRETGEELPPEISRLVKVAENLAEVLKAELGISGANIAVAETGTLVMVTNEGNGRLTTTLPPLMWPWLVLKIGGALY